MTTPTRNRRRRTWLYTAGFVIVGIVAAVVVSTLVVGRVGDQVDTSYVSAGLILVSADGRTLSTTASGACLDDTLEATETSTTVTLRVRVTIRKLAAPGTCAIRSFQVRLDAPLGSRQLVDGVSHRSLPFFDGKSILRPSHLPAGFAHAYDSASFGDETVVGSHAGCVQVYLRDGDYENALLISQDVGATWQTPDGVTLQPLTVRGQPGGAIPGEIEWTEHGQLFTLRSMAYAYATLSTQQLLDVAESLG